MSSSIGLEAGGHFLLRAMVILRIAVVIVVVGLGFVVEVGIVVERAGFDLANDIGTKTTEGSQRVFVEQGVLGLEDALDGVSIETPIVLSF